MSGQDIEPDKITAPFSRAQVRQLNRFQHCQGVHCFTCSGDRMDAAHLRYALRRRLEPGALVARRGGWRCPVCGYEQNWAWSFMANHSGIINAHSVRQILV